MKRILLAVALAVVPGTAWAQSFETIDDCQALRESVTAAVEEAHGLDRLLTDKGLSVENYLSQLYEGVKLLSKSGEMFFKAADDHESSCRTRLTQVNKLEEIRTIYDWYLEPTRSAYQFFKRAREMAVSLNRQGDVDAFNTMMTEYDAAVMKLVAVCESDLADTPYLSTCANLSVKLTDVLK